MSQEKNVVMKWFLEAFCNFLKVLIMDQAGPHFMWKLSVFSHLCITRLISFEIVYFSLVVNVLLEGITILSNFKLVNTESFAFTFNFLSFFFLDI